MTTQTVKALIEGGKATAAPPLGPALGPLGVNIGLVVTNINKKTESFKGMQVPVEVIVNSITKEFEIKVGTPPTSSLIKKESNLEKGSGNPLRDKIADLRIEQIIKIAKMKEDSLLGRTLKERVKEVIGTCNSVGVKVHAIDPREAIKKVNEGLFDKEIEEEKTELTAEELKALEAEKNRLLEEMTKRRAEFEKIAKEIIASMAGKPRGAIKAKLHEAKVPEDIIRELLPVQGAAVAGGEQPQKEGIKPEEKKEAKEEKKGKEEKKK